MTNQPGEIGAAIDRAARYLRETQQGGKNLTPWDRTPKATKKKWLLLAEGAILAATPPRNDGAGDVDRMRAERDEARAITKRVQSAAKTIMIGEADELLKLREEKRGEWLASKTLDSEREANAILTEENATLRAALSAAAAARDDGVGGVERVLRELLNYAEQDICYHDNRSRGGAIWEMCDDCGMRWADDNGGFKPHIDAKPVADARAALSALSQKGGWQAALAENEACAVIGDELALHDPDGNWAEYADAIRSRRSILRAPVSAPHGGDVG